MLYEIVLYDTSNSKCFTFLEKRECNVPLCTPKCPEYSLKNLRNQNGSAMMVIDIIVTNIEIPLGILDEIEIGMDLIVINQGICIKKG